MKKSRLTENSVDRVMHGTMLSLIRDFQTNMNDLEFCSDLRKAIRSEDITQIRQLAPTFDASMNTYVYKCTYQIASINKRFRYQNDIYTDQELEQKAIDSFQSTQERLAIQDLNNLSANSQIVLNLAAKYVAEVLGPWDDEEHRSRCRFGRRASVGIPARKASLAERWELPISGSPEQISWFDSVMSEIECVQKYWISQLERDPNRSIYQETTSLKLTLVPKTFKSLRSIMPNTTIGTFMTYGIGEMMRVRLKRAGYDIRTLQVRHRELAQRGSVHKQYVTADLSSASDSISVALVERLLPSDWFRILKRSRIGLVELPNGQLIESKTFCTMGVGYTFPLQTLIFLSLLKAIKFLYHGNLRSTISVYGDDLIYPSSIHKRVVEHFEELAFVINIDKTFHDCNFRESCGGDYYHGVDVRPFQPKNGATFVSRKAYEAILYKFLNGLLRRWSEYEIAGTIEYLTSEIERVAGCCKLVPWDFPDDSGLKCSLPVRYDFVKYAKIAHPKYLGNGRYRFSYLRLEPDLRKEDRHEPYLWSALSGGLESDHFYDRRQPLRDSRTLGQALDNLIGVRDEPSALITQELKPAQFVRSKLSGKRLRRLATFVTVSHSGRYVRQSGVSCFDTVDILP